LLILSGDPEEQYIRAYPHVEPFVRVDT
jgi:hypothetical protein